jgi:hypothetical protein
MGTSNDYTGGVGGAWTPYKHAASNFTRRGGERRADKVLARYVAAMGGAGGLSSSSGGAGAAVGSTQGLAGFASGLASGGLSATLDAFGLGHLVGADRYDVIDGLLEALAGDGSTREDQAILTALCEAFEELYPDDAETYEELEAVTLDADGVVELVEHFVARWVYDRLLPTLAVKFAHIEDPAIVAQRNDELRERIDLLAKLELEDRNPLTVDWRGSEGQDTLARLVKDMYEDMEGLDE